MQTKVPVVPPALAAEYLRRGLQLLESPRYGHPHSWITAREAIDDTGHTVLPESERAVAWCTIGVVKAVTHYDNNPEQAYRYVCSLLDASPVAISHGSLPASNDSASSFDRVRKTFLRAIKLADRLANK